MANTLAYELHNLKYWNVLSENAPCYIYIVQTRTLKLIKKTTEANTNTRTYTQNRCPQPNFKRNTQIRTKGIAS
jgi:hypothetical protein